MISRFQIASDRFMSFLQNKSQFAVLRMCTMAKKSSKVPDLFDLCKLTFSSPQTPLSSSAVQKLSSLLDTIGPVDVGLQQENMYDAQNQDIFRLNRFNRAAQRPQPLTYIDIYEGDAFTMCIFCFPSSTTIPLHDHPGMTVLSKVLYGSLHVKAYDWVEPACVRKISETGCLPVRLAKLAADKVLTAPCEPSVLYPKNGGNLHCFTAITPCAVLDILAPPYEEAAGRKCTYYRDYPYSHFLANGMTVNDGNEEDYAWLAEIRMPDNLIMQPGKYRGPAIPVD